MLCRKLLYVINLLRYCLLESSLVFLRLRILKSPGRQLLMYFDLVLLNVLQEHSKEELDSWKLLRVNEDFRVFALGVPVPRYPGNPLDPPLRSRFQSRDIPRLSYKVRFGYKHFTTPCLPLTDTHIHGCVVAHLIKKPC